MTSRSLRRTFVIPTLGIVLLVGLSLSFFAYLYSETLVERQIEARIKQLNHQVAVGLNNVFNVAESVLRHNAGLFGAEIIDYRNPTQIRDALFAQIRSFSVPTSLYFGNLNGGVVVAGHEGKGQQFYDITTDQFLAGAFTKRRIAEDGTPLKDLLVLPDYDARSRPWFQRAISNESTVTWGEVYVLFTGHDLSIAPSLTVNDSLGALIGVVGMDIFVSSIAPKLRSAQTIEGMITFLIEKETGLLIASSDDTKVFNQTENAKAFDRVTAGNSDNEMIASAANLLSEVMREKSGVAIGGDFDISHSDQNLVISVASLGGASRPDWLVVSVMPRATIGATIEAQFLFLVGLIVIACLISVAVVFYFSRRVTLPLGSLIETIDRQGNLELLSFARDVPRELKILRQSLVSAESRANESTALLKTEILNHELTNNALRQATNEAEEANRSKSQFLASMSHELRTPMNAVIGFSQMLKFSGAEPLTEKQAEYIDHVIDGGTHLNNLLNDVLDLARIEADQVSLSIQDVPIDATIRDSLALVQNIATQRGIVINGGHEGKSTETIQADPTRFKQVLVNLLSNAVKYNRDGGSVRIRSRVIDDQYCRLEIEDTGIGIEEEECARIFDMFHRSKADPMIAREGVGIGLSVSKVLIEKMGGQIGVKSELGVGSTFWIDLALSSNKTVLIWSEKYRVGIDIIDADHQVIFALTNVLSQNRVGPDQLDAAIDELIEYTSYHFAREEALMESCGYPDLEAHKQYHLKLVEQINKIAGEWKEQRSDQIRQKLRIFLKDWWVKHITNVDKTIAAYAVKNSRS